MNVILVAVLAVAGVVFGSGKDTQAEQLCHIKQKDILITAGFPQVSTDTRLSPGQSETDPDEPTADDHSGTTFPIRIYQRLCSNLRGRGCQFEPSCSEFASVAIREHGFVLGSALAADRLNRCNNNARRFYRRAPSGRLSDPVPGTAGSARGERAVPGWLLPPSEPDHMAHICSLDSLAGSQRDNLEFAFDLMRERDYFRAGTEFKRVGSASNSPSVKAMARFYVAENVFASGDWKAAVIEYTHVRQSYPDTRWSEQAGFMAGMSLFNLGDYRACRAEMEVFTGANAVCDVSDEAHFLSGLSYLEEGQWRSASAAFAQALSLPHLQNSPYPFDLMARESLGGEKLPTRSGFLAALMSAVVPGAGQMYSGRFWDGMRALTVNGLLILSAYKLVEDEHYAGAYLVTGITVPFYVGNIIGARAAADDYDRRQRTELIDCLIVRCGESTSGRQPKDAP